MYYFISCAVIFVFLFFSTSARKNHKDNRSRKNEILLYLSDDEKYIPDNKVKISGMKSRAAFIRHFIIYGFVYDIDYSQLQEYNTPLSRISNNLNQIAKRMNATGHVYDASTFACGVETAPYDFNFALSKTKQSDPNKAFHMIQSFVPGEVTCVKNIIYPLPLHPIIKEKVISNGRKKIQDKFQQSPGLNHWAAVQNLKIAASSYAGADSRTD